MAIVSIMVYVEKQPKPWKGYCGVVVIDQNIWIGGIVCCVVTEMMTKTSIKHHTMSINHSKLEEKEKSFLTSFSHPLTMFLKAFIVGSCTLFQLIRLADHLLNSLPNNKILNLVKLRVSAETKLNIAKLMTSVCD